jgi:hypothetical protein
VSEADLIAVIPRNWRIRRVNQCMEAHHGLNLGLDLCGPHGLPPSAPRSSDAAHDAAGHASARPPREPLRLLTSGFRQPTQKVISINGALSAPV